MPKKTVKYSSALDKCWELNLPVRGDQTAVYQRLMDAGYLWDSKIQVWLQLDAEPADAPSSVIRIRVWAEQGKAMGVAESVIHGLGKQYKLIEQSGTYPCRPPKQKEERIYLSFLKETL